VAEKLNSRDFTTAADIVAGHERLNLAFTATIFNNHIGIHFPTEDEIAELYSELTNLKNLVIYISMDSFILLSFPSRILHVLRS
jgi:hypothetical protein